MPDKASSPKVRAKESAKRSLIMVTKQPGSSAGDEWFQWTRKAWKLLW